MGRTSSISQAQGEALLNAVKRLGNVAQAAREIGVTESSARRYLKEIPKAATPVVAAQREMIESVGVSLFESTAALEENYRKVLRLINQLEAGIVELKESPQGQYMTTVSPKVLVAALKEAREYIDSARAMLELMISVNEVRRFQQSVLDVLATEVDEPTRQRIFTRLRQQLPLGLLPGRGG